MSNDDACRCTGRTIRRILTLLTTVSQRAGEIDNEWVEVSDHFGAPDTLSRRSDIRQRCCEVAEVLGMPIEYRIDKNGYSIRLKRS